ncbi:MAG: sensor histidine kinase [Duncaniella sp.]|nr:sensor histidine kinase [Duncaniella sp.]
MPLLIILGPAKYWWRISPAFACVAVSYLYGCYFATKALRLPQLILVKSYCKLAGIAAVLLLLTYLVTLFQLPDMDFVIPSMSEYQTSVRNYNITIAVWLMFSVVICYSLTVAFIKELYSRLLLQNKIENQRDKAELALYKAQINPHFLFNTLNSLYSLVIGTSQRAEDAFIKFTELLKYTYVTADSDWVTIKDEIDYINNYIDLQLIRLDEHTRVIRDCSVDDESANIPPMIFLTFVENTFKYGTSTSRNCEILIRLRLNDGVLLFETQNCIMRYSDQFRKDMPVGISNCRSRLSGLFSDRYTLDIKEEDGVFKVCLKINLSKT